MARSLPFALTGVAALCASYTAQAACPPLTVDNMQGLTPQYPQQFELGELQDAAQCELAFSQNPRLAELNARIAGNGELAPVGERLPAEPLVVVPYASLGQYGGVLTGLSKATESGTSDLLSVRHVNLVRYSDDLKTIVPNVAKSWSWNADFTELRFELRAGHKWSDGAPFTAEDVAFWYNDIILNPDVYAKTPDRWLFGGEPASVEAEGAQTVVFRFPVPTPGIVNRFAVDYGQAFQPKHVLSRFMPKYNSEAEAEAVALGFESAAAAVDFYYGGSDWKDVPSPLLKDAELAGKLDHAVLPTLESYIVVEETAEGRYLVANPYFHQVDSAGRQLPYIDAIDERYVQEKEVQNLKIMNGEVVWKQQALFLEDFPLLKENESKGGYTAAFAPTLGENIFYSPNTTHKDPVLREIFSDIRFRRALSIAINRDEINEIVYLGQGRPMQSTLSEPSTVNFIGEDSIGAYTQYDVDGARELIAQMGLADSDGDGVVERGDGKPLVIRLVYSTQGAPAKMHELVRDYWAAIGVRVDLKEVTSDEYRADGNNNDLDITVWKNDGNSGPTISQDVTAMVPPFGDYFNPGTGFEWAAYRASDGAEGTPPPAHIAEMVELAEQFITLEFGSEAFDQTGARLNQIYVDNLLKIGTVGDIVGPYVHRNDLQNVVPLTAKSYDFYWTYPYRPAQWWLKP